jgi:hypothetical protein
MRQMIERIWAKAATDTNAINKRIKEKKILLDALKRGALR